jgi:toxin ParE1/3/4
MKPVQFHDEADAEFEADVDYYEQKQAGLGGRFRAAVEDAVAAIRACPTVYSPIPGTAARKRLVDGFPYSVFFVELDAWIWIAAVAHHKRRQGYWVHRSPDN